MKFGLAYNTAYYGTDPDLMVAAARHAEECGFESFHTSEHIVMYPGAAAGPVQFPPDLAVADPLECLAYVAAATTSLLLGTAHSQGGCSVKSGPRGQRAVSLKQ